MQCHDWECAQAWREWRLKYRPEALFEEKFYNRFRTEMIGFKDTHFFVGTLRAHPTTWTIIGLFYPPKDSATDG